MADLPCRWSAPDSQVTETMKLLRVDANLKGSKSNSHMLADEFVAQIVAACPALEIDSIDLATQQPAHVTAEFAKATYTQASERTQVMKDTLNESNALCERVLACPSLETQCSSRCVCFD